MDLRFLARLEYQIGLLKFLVFVQNNLQPSNFLTCSCPLQPTTLLSNIAFQFVCDTQELNNVKKGIEAQGIEVHAARFGYIPTSYAEIDDEMIQNIMPMFDKLDKIDEVVRVYDNFKAKS